jgi:hypothetical protein
MWRDPIPGSKTNDDPDGYRRMTGNAEVTGVGSSEIKLVGGSDEDSCSNQSENIPETAVTER